MNLKDWILNYLNQEKKSLNSRINQYQTIVRDAQMDEYIRQERLKMMNDFDMQGKNSYRLNLNYNFIKARTARMLDIISGHMPAFYPGSIASKKYGESRIILQKIEDALTAYMGIGFYSQMNNTVEVTIQEQETIQEESTVEEETVVDGKAIVVTKTVLIPKTISKSRIVRKNAALVELDRIIALANTLDYKYCDAYDKP